MAVETNSSLFIISITGFFAYLRIIGINDTNEKLS